jgi:hypothetical protein
MTPPKTTTPARKTAQDSLIGARNLDPGDGRNRPGGLAKERELPCSSTLPRSPTRLTDAEREILYMLTGMKGDQPV